MSPETRDTDNDIAHTAQHAPDQIWSGSHTVVFSAICAAAGTGFASALTLGHVLENHTLLTLNTPWGAAFLSVMIFLGTFHWKSHVMAYHDTPKARLMNKTQNGLGMLVAIGFFFAFLHSQILESMVLKVGGVVHFLYSALLFVTTIPSGIYALFGSLAFSIVLIGLTTVYVLACWTQGLKTVETRNLTLRMRWTMPLVFLFSLFHQQGTDIIMSMCLTLIGITVFSGAMAMRKIAATPQA